MVHWTGPIGLPGWANQTRSTQSIGDPTDTSSPLPPRSRLCSTPTPPPPPTLIPMSLGHSGRRRWLQRTSTRGSTPPPCLIRPVPPLVAALNPSGLGFRPAAAVLRCSSSAAPTGHHRALMWFPPGPRVGVARRGWCHGATTATAAAVRLPQPRRRRDGFVPATPATPTCCRSTPLSDLDAGRTACPTQPRRRRFPHCEPPFYLFPSSSVYCKVQHDPLIVLMIHQILL
jgi:hypothetical protein